MKSAAAAACALIALSCISRRVALPNGVRTSVIDLGLALAWGDPSAHYYSSITLFHVQAGGCNGGRPVQFANLHQVHRKSVIVIALRNALLMDLFVTTVATAQGNETSTEEGCSLCAQDEVVTMPDLLVEENTAGFTLADQTCREIEDLANSGYYS